MPHAENASRMASGRARHFLGNMEIPRARTNASAGRLMVMYRGTKIGWASEIARVAIVGRKSQSVITPRGKEFWESFCFCEPRNNCAMTAAAIAKETQS